MSEQKKKEFKTRVVRWGDKLDINVEDIAVRPMKSKWASCSTAGRLTFDSTLLELSGELQDYVIVHELLHFRVPNHGPLWKSLMRAYLGDFESSEKMLKSITGKK